MANKKFWVGMLVMVLVFGMTVIYAVFFRHIFAALIRAAKTSVTLYR